MLPAEQLAAIRERVHAHGRRAGPRLAARSCCRRSAAQGIDCLSSRRSCTPEQRKLRARALRRSGAAGADAAGGRSRPSVSAPQATSRSTWRCCCVAAGAATRRGRPRETAAGGGAGAERARPAGARCRRRAGSAPSCCSATSSTRTSASSFPATQVQAHGALSRHPQLRPARRRGRVGRSACRRFRRSCGGASGAPPCGWSCAKTAPPEHRGACCAGAQARARRRLPTCGARCSSAT